MIELNANSLLKAGVELGCATIASDHNAQSSALLKYFWTNQLGYQVSSRLSETNDIISIEPDSASYSELTVYFSIFSAIFKGPLSSTKYNNEFLLSILSSPTVVDFVTKSPQFREMFSEVTHCEFQLIKSVLYKIFKEYAFGNGSFSSQLEKNDEIQNSVIRLIVNLVKNEFSARRSAGKNLLREAVNLSNVSMDQDWDESVVSVFDSLSAMRSSVKTLSSTSLMSFLLRKPQGEKKIAAPLFHERIINGYYLAKATNLTVAPLIFVSATPDLAELAVRAAGVGAAVFSDQYLLSTIVTELALKAVPSMIEQHPYNLAVLAQSTEARDYVMNHLNGFLKECETVLLQQGNSKEQIESAKSEILQAASALIYYLIAGESHPAILAIYTQGFLAMMASLAANHGLAKPELFNSKSEKSTYLLFLAHILAVSCLDFKVPRATAQIFAITGRIPFVFDSIIDRIGYDEKSLLKQNLKFLFKAKDFSRMACKGYGWARGYLPSFVTTTLEGGVSLVGAGAIGTAAYLIKKEVQSEAFQQKYASAKKLGSSAWKSVLTANTVSLCSQYLGPVAGSLVPLIGNVQKEPIKTTAVGVTALAANYISSGSSVLTALAIETADFLISNEYLTGLTQRIGDCFLDRFQLAIVS